MYLNPHSRVEFHVSWINLFVPRVNNQPRVLKIPRITYNNLFAIALLLHEEFVSFSPPLLNYKILAIGPETFNNPLKRCLVNEFFSDTLRTFRNGIHNIIIIDGDHKVGVAYVSEKVLFLNFEKTLIFFLWHRKYY